jgi:hypothetical protein
MALEVTAAAKENSQWLGHVGRRGLTFGVVGLSRSAVSILNRKIRCYGQTFP